jgi:hypothetical protein
VILKKEKNMTLQVIIILILETLTEDMLKVFLDSFLILGLIIRLKADLVLFLDSKVDLVLLIII